MKSPNPEQPAKKPWSRLLSKLAKIAAFAVVAPITLSLLLLAWLGFSGRMEWDRVKRELLARGEKLSYTELASAGPSGAMNVYDHPMFRELATASPDEFKDRQFLMDKLLSVQTPEGLKSIPLTAGGDKKNPDVFFDNVVAKMRKERLPGAESESKSSAQIILSVLDEVSGEWQAAEQILERPVAKPLAVRERFETPSFLGKLLALAQFLSLRSRAALATGDARLAAHDTRLSFRLADIAGSEPLMITEMVRWAILGLPVYSIQRGIGKHAWNEQELREFERLILRGNVLETSGFALRGERGIFNQLMERMASSGKFPRDFGIESMENKPVFISQATAGLYARCLLYSDMAAHNFAIQQKIDLLEKQDPTAKVIFGKPTIWETLRAPFSSISRSTMDEFVVRANHTQVLLDQTLIAIGLELYWFQHGSYPEKLSELPGKFLSRGTKDRMSGSEMLYRKTSPDSFDLWSVGWNRVDDDGIQERRDREKEDWVWGK